MQETFSVMKSRIDDFCIQLELDAGRLPDKGEPGRIEALRALLDRMVGELGVYDYSFSYTAQRFASRKVEDCIEELREIYREDCHAPFYEGDSRTPGRVRLRAFAAFFLLVTYYIHFKMQKEADELMEEQGYDREIAFQDMPLYFDLVSRFGKRSNDISETREALYQERKAIDMLEKRGCQNVAVNCSFASTVSIMLQRSWRVSNSDAKKAVSLINEAIAYNPDYAKYHYIRAKLRFYLEAEKLAGRPRLESLLIAKKECMEAYNCENSYRVDYHHRVGDYMRFLEQIDCEIDQLEEELTDQESNSADSPEALEALRKAILASSCEAELTQRPPANAYGGRYVFICYSRADYKLVYSDLLEMAARRIPFLYDQDTVLPGYDWDEAVAKRIQDPNCAGIIFYLGASAVLSEPLDKEVQVVLEKAERQGVLPSELLFTVNLTEKNEKPSEMLIHAIRDCTKTELRKAHLDSERIVRFLSTFTDNGDFIRRGDRPEDLRHMKRVEDTIRKKFQIHVKRE